jgi:hypothetical protein
LGVALATCFAAHGNSGAAQLALARKSGFKDFSQRLRAVRGRLPADFKFDRNKANAW